MRHNKDMRRRVLWSLLAFLLAMPVPAQRAKEKAEPPLASMPGYVRGADARTLNIELPDGNIVLFRCSKKTRWLDGARRIAPSALREGDLVEVEAARALDGTLQAVTVRLRHGRDAGLPAPRQ